MPSDRMHRILIVTGLLLLLPLLPACQRTMVEQTMLERHPSELDDFAFWDALAAVSEAEGGTSNVFTYAPPGER